MKTLHNSAVGDFTRGGQVTIHFLRMIGQVFQKFGLASVMLYGFVTMGFWFGKTTEHERYLGTRYVMATAGVWLGNGANVTDIRLENGRVIKASISSLATSPKMRQNARGLAGAWLKSMGQSVFVAGFLILVLLVWLFKFGRSQRAEKHLRGGKVVDGPELAKLIRSKGLAGPYEFGGIPLVKDFETAHTLFAGSSGTGKTTGMYELMKQIRKRGDRVVCFSPSGDFLSWFYRADKDTILNIFDGRSPRWDLWGECDMPYHYPMIGASLVPTPQTGDKIWAEAGQTLVAVILEKMKEDGTTSWAELSKIVSSLPIATVYRYLEGTRVANYLDPNNEKMGASIRSTASIALRCIDYMIDKGEGFTFKDWVNGPDDGSWVFLNARADQLDAARPILSTMIEVFVNRVLSLSESRDRRIWLIIDELPALNKLTSLGAFVEQARKFGGCGVLGFQQFSQLTERYGKELASSIVGQCNTWVCYRQNDPETAKFVAEKFGKVEIEENQQGLSYGANDMRDGVSLSQQRKDRDVVMASEVLTLPNLTGFIKLAGDLPGGRFALKRTQIKQIAEPFVLRVEDPLEKILAIPQHQLIELGGDDSTGIGLPTVDESQPMPDTSEDPSTDNSGDPKASSDTAGSATSTGGTGKLIGEDLFDLPNSRSATR